MGGFLPSKPAYCSYPMTRSNTPHARSNASRKENVCVSVCLAKDFEKWQHGAARKEDSDRAVGSRHHRGPHHLRRYQHLHDVVPVRRRKGYGN
jgi:hypothetical protein